MKKIRKTLLFIMVATTINAVAQTGYQSFLNCDTIKWYVLDEVLDAGSFSYMFIATDTFDIDSVTCRTLTFSSVTNVNGIYNYHSYPPTTVQYLSEDTNIGRLYMYYKNIADTTPLKKLLLVDMSLGIADTFVLPLLNNGNSADTLFYIVDSINYYYGKKHIFMHNNRFGYNMASNIFIEGVGCSMNIFEPVANYGLGWSEEIRKLTCNYKDDVLDYQINNGGNNNNEECVPLYCQIHKPSENLISKITAYPNPAKDRITLDFGGEQFETLQVINTAGVVVREAYLGGQTQYSLPLKGLPTGVYIYRVYGTNITEGKFIK